MIIDGKRKFDGIYNGNDVDRELEMYLNQLQDYSNGRPFPFEKETNQYSRVIIPDGYDVPRPKKGTKDWQHADYWRYSKKKQAQIEEFWRYMYMGMLDGYESMSGMMFGFYNFGWMKGSGGIHQVDWRRNDNELLWLIDSCVNGDNQFFEGNHKKGVIEIGKRRSGKSAKIGYAILHWLTTRLGIDIVVTSKTEDDAADVIIGQKVQFMYDNFPIRLKPKIYRRNRGLLHLGDKIRTAAGFSVGGVNSRVFANASRPESTEGQTLFAWIADEIGKTKDFQHILDMNLPALMGKDGYNREGFCYLTGVAGDMSKFPGAKNVWNQAESYGLIRWFSPAWSGVYCDKYGNEDIVRTVREELMKRNQILKNRSLTPSERDIKIRRRQQQFPLTVEESFLDIGGGRFDTIKINTQIGLLENDPIEVYSGTVEWEVPKLKAKMTPSISGKVLYIEPPKPGCKYIMGIDAYSLKQTDEGSSGAAWVFKTKNTDISPLEEEHLIASYREEMTMKKKLEIMLRLGHLPVACYVDKPKNPKTFADRAAALGNWYERLGNGGGGTKYGEKVMILTETQPSIIFDYLMETYPSRVMNAPLRPDKKPTRNDLFNKFGLDMKGYWAEKRLGEISHYIDKYYTRLFFMKLLEKLNTYNPEVTRYKHDLVDAFGVVLIMMSDPRIKEWCGRYAEKVEEKKGPIISWKRMG